MGAKLKPNIRAIKKKSVVRMGREKKLTQPQMAKKAKVSVSTVARWLDEAGLVEKKVRFKKKVNRRAVKKAAEQFATKTAMKNKVSLFRIRFAPKEADIRRAKAIHHLLHAQDCDSVPSIEMLAKAVQLSALLNGK